jgi:uncharacterized protein
VTPVTPPDPAAAARHVGVGLRPAHHDDWLDRAPRVAFVEVHSENFMADGGALPALLRRVRADHAVSLHGVGLSLGSACGVDERHLARLAALARAVEPVRVSDHAAFARAPLDGPRGEAVHAADLLPLAFNDGALAILADNVARVQEVLRRPILVEHLSAYIGWADGSRAEPEFFNALARRTGCGLLLDVNNLVVNAMNLGAATRADPLPTCRAWIDALDPDIVGEIHLAGHRDLGDLVIDDHGSPVPPVVWALFDHALRRLGPRPTLVEWDTDLPPLQSLLDEAALAEAAIARAAPGASPVAAGAAR